MATKFTFTLESDGLNNEQAATFASFVKSLQVQSAQIPFNYAAVDEAVDSMAAQRMTNEVKEQVKKKRASKIVESPIGIAEMAKGYGASDTVAFELEKAKALTPMQTDALNMEYAIDQAVAEQEAEAAEMLYEDMAEVLDVNGNAADTTQEPQAAAAPKSDVTLDTLKKLVGEKQAAHRDEIKAYFLKKGGYKTTTLPDSLYKEFHDLLTAMT